MDRKKAEKALDCRANDSKLDCRDCAYYIREDTPAYCNFRQILRDAIALLKDQQQQIWEFQDQVEYLTDKLKEHEGLLGIRQTADSITFISTGTAQQGENRGLLLGKYAMHEWLEKELLYRGLLTDDIRAVFDEAKLQEGR